MSITVLERANSRPLIVDPKAMSATGEFWALSTDITTDASEINDAVALSTTNFYGNLVKKSIKSTPQGGGFWYVTVEYGQIEGEALDGQGEASEPTTPPEKQLSDRLGKDFGFTTAGGTQHIVCSRGTKSYKRTDAAAPAPKFGGAIGVSKGEVTGTDIIVPKFEFTITKRVEFLTLRYVRKLMRATGTTNDRTWQTFFAGEVLFLGAEGNYDGDSRNDESWLVTYKFSAGENEEGVVIVPDKADDGAGGQVNQPSLTVDRKSAWDHIWVAFREENDSIAGVNVRKPCYAYVEQVYRRTDFKDQLGF